MVFEIGNFTFVSVSEDNLELVRTWRNREEVREKMVYKNCIQFDDQLKWYRSIRNISNIYYVAQYKSIPFAVMNFKQINWDAEFAESGIFVGLKEFLITEFPAIAALLLMDFAFQSLGFEKIFSKTLISNSNLTSYSRKLGYQLISSDELTQNWQLQKNDFLSQSAKLVRSARILSGCQNFYLMTMTEDDISLGFHTLLNERLRKTNTNYSVDKIENNLVFTIKYKE